MCQHSCCQDGAIIREQRLHRFTTPITLYEKFGDTQQLVQNYELEIEISFDA
nr:hypothetical protein [uncultured Desulfuromonas sp.]